MKISRTQIDIIVKVLLFFVGSVLVLTSLARILTPNLNKFPALDSCFETSVHKVLLCSDNPNYVKLDNISEVLVRAIIMSEDDKFFDHKGVDWVEIKNSLKKNIKQRHFARGGSTITQQLVKNAYLHQGKSLTRKFKEYFLAKAIEEKYPKALILEKYLNLIELGVDLYGVKRAAQFYFNKPASDLEMLESLYMVTLIPSPKKTSKSFTDKKLSPWQVKKIKSLLHNFQRRGQIDPSERVQLENLIPQFPWDDIQTDIDSETSDVELDSLNTGEEDETTDDGSTNEDPMFPNFRATPSSPDEEELPTDDDSKNNSYEEDSNDLNQRFGTYNPSSSEDDRDGNDEQDHDTDDGDHPPVYEGEDEDDIGYDAEGF